MNTEIKNIEEIITQIVFTKVGHPPYRFEKVEVNHPLQNVAGLTRIGQFYYREAHFSPMQELGNELKRATAQNLLLIELLKK